jgi:hypothetical protein
LWQETNVPEDCTALILPYPEIGAASSSETVGLLPQHHMASELGLELNIHRRENFKRRPIEIYGVPPRIKHAEGVRDTTCPQSVRFIRVVRWGDYK